MADGNIRKDYYTEITNKVLAALEAGPPPWKQPWDSRKAAQSGPLNGVTRHRYRGINTLMLGMSAMALGSEDPRWLSFQQARDKGWQIRKGERATTVIFFKKVEVSGSSGTATPDEEGKVIPVLRGYPVFNAVQVDGIPDYMRPGSPDTPWRTPEAASVILTSSGVQYQEGGDRAFYSPAKDIVQLPPRCSFQAAEGWAGTLLHELGHATGHPSRLNRDLANRYGSKAYALEELRAELASAFLGNELGLPGSINNHAAYLDSWLEVLRSDKREIFRAAADAQKMADYSLSFHPLYAARLNEDGRVASDVAAPLKEQSISGEMPSHIRATLARQQPNDLGSHPAPVQSPTDMPTPRFRL